MYRASELSYILNIIGKFGQNLGLCILCLAWIFLILYIYYLYKYPYIFVCIWICLWQACAIGLAKYFAALMGHCNLSKIYETFSNVENDLLLFYYLAKFWCIEDASSALALLQRAVSSRHPELQHTTTTSINTTTTITFLLLLLYILLPIQLLLLMCQKKHVFC